MIMNTCMLTRKFLYMHYKETTPVSFRLPDPVSKGTEYKHDQVSANTEGYFDISESCLLTSKHSCVYFIRRIDIISSHFNNDNSSCSRFQCGAK